MQFELITLILSYTQFEFENCSFCYDIWAFVLAFKTSQHNLYKGKKATSFDFISDPCQINAMVVVSNINLITAIEFG